MESKPVDSPKTKDNIYAVIGTLVIISLAFRMILYVQGTYSLDELSASLIFVGLPAWLSLLVIKYFKTDSYTSYVFKTITLFLLISSILFGEGTICILMAAPIFYGIGFLVVLIRAIFKNNNKHFFIVIWPLLFFMAELHQINSPSPVLKIQNKQLIDADLTLNAFNKSPNFIEKLPTFFKTGFPKPLAIEGKGIKVGDYRKIDFLSETRGLGTLHLKVIEKTTDKIVFEPVTDSTHIGRWLSWQRVTVEIKANEKGQKEVIWTTAFTCDLRPNWYFQPLEKYGVSVMNKHLLNTYFKPKR